MSELLELDTRPAPLCAGAGERLARAELRRQIGRLECELAGLFAESFRRAEIDCGVGALCGEPRVLGLGELERVRDELATRVGEARLALDERTRLETRNRELLRRMLADPASHRWVRVSRHDVGEPGCGGWHSQPRFGPLGMLMGWWRVKVSSGCPLSGRLAAVERLSKKAKIDERPPAPWGSFPLAELTVLAGIVALAIGLIGQIPTAIGVGVVLGGLGGLEVSVREHFAGYRSHTTLLAGAAFVLVVGGLFYLANLILAVCLAAGAVVFVAAFLALRRAFQRASGGLSFRAGGLG
jgi:hypothetical protein